MLPEKCHKNKYGITKYEHACTFLFLSKYNLYLQKSEYSKRSMSKVFTLINGPGVLQFTSPKNDVLGANIRHFGVLKPVLVAFCHLSPIKSKTVVRGASI